MEQHSVIVQPEAQEDIDAIRVYQNSLEPKRGQRLIEALETCLSQLKANPSFQKRKRNFLHIMLNELPYCVVLEVE